MTATEIRIEDELTAEAAPVHHPSRRSRRTEVILQVSLIAIGLLVSLPIFIAIFTSFTPLPRILSDPNSIWTSPWTLQNYVRAWTATPFGRFMLNSFIQTGLITFFQVFLSILAGYAFAMFEFRGKKVMFAVLIGSLMVPFELTFIPNFLVISDLGNLPILGQLPVIGDWLEGISWANTYQGLVIPFLAIGGWALYYFVQQMVLHTGIGPTNVEVSALPLLPGASYSVFLTQAGHLSVDWLELRLVCEEEVVVKNPRSKNLSIA